MSENQPKLKFEEDKERTATRSPPKKSKVEQTVPKKKKLKLNADKAAEKSQHLRFGKAEITPDEASRMTKQQKRAMYAAAAARSAAHREVDQYEDDNVGTQALNEGLKSEEAVSDFSKNRYVRKLKKKAKLQAKKNTPTAKSSTFGPDKAQNAEKNNSSTSSEGGSNWFSKWKQKKDIQEGYRAAVRSGGAAAQTAGDQKAASSGASVAKSGMERVIDKGKSVVSTAVNGIANFAKSNAHVLWIVGVFLLFLLLVMSAFSSCSIIFSGTTQVSGQTIYTAEDRDIKGGRIQTTLHYDPVDGLAAMPEFGVLFKIDADYDTVEWYGNGPAETYWDRQHGAKLGIYQNKVAENVAQYLVPQECGAKTAVRWAKVVDRKGRGLLFSADAEKPMMFSALPYTPHEMENAKHPYELPPVHYTVIRVIGEQMGVGGDDSWGANVHPEYIPDVTQPKEFTFTFRGI